MIKLKRKRYTLDTHNMRILLLIKTQKEKNNIFHDIEHEKKNSGIIPRKTFLNRRIGHYIYYGVINLIY